jgi:hypothetical protein
VAEAVGADQPAMMRDVRTAEGLAKSRGVLLVSDRQPAFAEVLHFVLRALDQRGAAALHRPLAKSAVILADGDMRHRRGGRRAMQQRREKLAQQIGVRGRRGDQHGARAIIEPARNWFQPKNGNQPALADKRSARGAGKETGSGSFYGASVSTGSDAGSGCNLDPRATAPSGRTPR